MCFRTSGVFCFSKHGCLKDLIFSILGIISNRCYQDPLQHLLLTVILYDYKIFLLQIRIWGTTSYTFSRRLWTPCRSVTQRVCFRKSNMLHTVCKHFWITSGFFLLANGSKNWLPHNWGVACILFWQFIAFISQSDFQMQQHLKEYIEKKFLFFSMMLEQEEYTFVEAASVY